MSRVESARRTRATGTGVSSAERTRNARGQGERLCVALLDAAESLLTELGDPGALSVRAVTARAGVTPTALYLHFSDLGELVLGLEERSFAQLFTALEQAGRGHDGDPWAQLMAMGGAYCDFAASQPAAYRLLFNTYVSGGRIMPREARARAAASKDAGIASFEILAGAVARLVPQAPDPFPLAVRVWCALHGYVSLQPVMPQFPMPAREEYLASTLHALLADG